MNPTTPPDARKWREVALRLRDTIRDCIEAFEVEAQDHAGARRDSLAEVVRRSTNQGAQMAKQTSAQYSLLATTAYGLFVGYVEAYNPLTKIARVRDCRNVRYWYGRTGGVTSLAVFGLCGPRAAESRIGAAVPGVSTLTEIQNVYPCTDVARASFEASVQK